MLFNCLQFLRLACWLIWKKYNPNWSWWWWYLHRFKIIGWDILGFIVEGFSSGWCAGLHRQRLRGSQNSVMFDLKDFFSILRGCCIIGGQNSDTNKEQVERFQESRKVWLASSIAMQGEHHHVDCGALHSILLNLESPVYCSFLHTSPPSCFIL